MPKTVDQSKALKLILTFHPHNVKVKNILLQNLHILEGDGETRHLVAEKTVCAYRRATNLRDLLVRSQLPKTDISHGTVPCGRPRCKTCKLISSDTAIVCPNKTFHVREAFNCASRNLIYAIRCKRCLAIYIGETGRPLSTRVSEHIRDISSEAHKPVPMHFDQSGHGGANDFEVQGIKKCHRDHASRLHMEQKLIFEFGTFSPRGLNSQHMFL